MDDEFEKLEAELRRLRPTAPSAALEQRLSRALARPSRRTPSSAWRWAWLVLPVAAAAVIAVALVPHASQSGAKNLPTTASSLPPFKPVAAENVLVSSEDEGLVTLADGTSARRLRQSYVDTITWKNPRTHASLTWSLPREEVRVIPLVLQ